MPAYRIFPRFVPRFIGTRLRIVIGRPVTARIQPLVDAYREVAGGPHTVFASGAKDTPRPPLYEGDSNLAKVKRIEIARVLREEVERLGRNRADLKDRRKGDAEELV